MYRHKIFRAALAGAVLATSQGGLYAAYADQAGVPLESIKSSDELREEFRNHQAVLRNLQEELKIARLRKQLCDLGVAHHCIVPGEPAVVTAEPLNDDAQASDKAELREQAAQRALAELREATLGKLRSYRLIGISQAGGRAVAVINSPEGRTIRARPGQYLHGNIKVIGIEANAVRSEEQHV